jgi:biotin-dependent carboxylase-like uncharacterized protein
MSRALFVVEHVGPLTTIQDEGRSGFMRYGVPRSGPMDRGAFAVAQAALGNPSDASAIEATIGGLTLRCIEGDVTFATAGGGFRVEIDGIEIGSWAVATIHAGSRLAIKPGHWGSWTYLAVAGRIDARSWLGSAATHAVSGLGGGCLTAGQRIVVEDAQVREERRGGIPLPVTARPRAEIRIVLGPQDRFFAPETIAALLDQPFRLTSEYDRMGVRLKGASLPIAAPLDMPSEPLVRGAVQVPGHGDPIVLLADHQTTAGYPKIATLASVDQDAFVQLRMGQRVLFKAVSAEEAIAAARTRHLTEARFLDHVARRTAALKPAAAC